MNCSNGTMDEFKKLLESMAGEHLHNYAIAGLRSSLFTDGTVRLFHQLTHPMSMIAPHSHRYDIASLVISGEVMNTIWTKTHDYSSSVQLFCESTLQYSGKPGQYTKEYHGDGRYNFKTESYKPGDLYFMTSDVVHSIKFARGTRVMIFQGPTVADSNLVIDPYLPDGRVVPTSDIQDWMFQGSKHSVKIEEE